MSDALSDGERWCCTHLPKFYELYRRSDKSHPHNYFVKIFPDHIHEVWKKSYKVREEFLGQLDSEAWEQLVKKAVPLVTTRDSRRGWYQLINHLDEARGWVLLKERGYEGIRFIENQNGKTPDLIGTKGSSTAILEVKSLNQSDDDINSLAARKPFQVFDARHGLSEKFKHRLFRSIREAREQLEAFHCGADKKIALLVIRFDTDHLFADQNYAELQQLISNHQITGLELVHQNAM